MPSNNRASGSFGCHCSQKHVPHGTARSVARNGSWKTCPVKELFEVCGYHGRAELFGMHCCFFRRCLPILAQMGWSAPEVTEHTDKLLALKS